MLKIVIMAVLAVAILWQAFRSDDSSEDKWNSNSRKTGSDIQREDADSGSTKKLVKKKGIGRVKAAADDVALTINKQKNRKK